MNFMTSALSILLALSQPATSATTNNHKRWYGIQLLNNNEPKSSFGPWPFVCDSQSVRYCFADARSQRNLEPIVNQAVAKWAHATLTSNLQIIPDNEQAPLCSSKDVRPDALVITDMTKDNDKPWNRGPQR